MSDKARDQEKIRNLENENAKVAELERRNREFERKSMESEERALEYARRSKELERKFYALEDAVYKSITKQPRHSSNCNASQCTCQHEAAKPQSPDYGRGNRDVN